jgi:hypothetical protein
VGDGETATDSQDREVLQVQRERAAAVESGGTMTPNVKQLPAHYAKCRCCGETRDLYPVTIEPYGTEILEVDIDLCAPCVREFLQALEYNYLQHGVTFR